MPPAFNLSQDQTLQFNACLTLARLTRMDPGPGLRPIPTSTNQSHEPCQPATPVRTCVSCEHYRLLSKPPGFTTLARSSARHQSTPAPTPIDCQLLKSRLPSPLRLGWPSVTRCLAGRCGGGQRRMQL